jgi:hypothetical protein
MPSVTLTCSSEISWVEGQLPLELGSLTELLRIEVHYSDLSAGSGSIPNSITLCSKLKSISLFRNKMRGIIPKDIGSLILLEYLYISEIWELAGVLPVGICMCKKLYYLDIEDTSIEGKRPALT